MFETPGLLIQGTEKEYIERFISIFSPVNQIIIPEKPDKKIVIYTNKIKDIQHIWQGGKKETFDSVVTQRRAQRINWIKYVIETPQIRTIYYDNKTDNICFFSSELEYQVVIREGKNYYFLVTSFHIFDAYRNFINTSRFEPYFFGIKKGADDGIPHSPMTR